MSHGPRKFFVNRPDDLGNLENWLRRGAVYNKSNIRDNSPRRVDLYYVDPETEREKHIGIVVVMSAEFTKKAIMPMVKMYEAAQ